MKPFFWRIALVVLLAGTASVSAQTATPAQPADPTQARPAQPVFHDSLTPPELAQPGPNSAPNATNAPGTPISPTALSILADSSLKLVLQELAQAWADSQASNPQVPLILTNAGTERTKIESGAACDVIISADVQDVKDLTDKGLLFADGQRTLARNTLVILGRKALIKDDELDWFDLIGTEWKKVALGNPDLVASGRVAKSALQKHDLLDDEHKSLYIYTLTETLALAEAERDQADAVFVYKTDLAKASLPGFEVFALKTEDAPPIFYTAAVSRLAKNPTQAHAFIDYCNGDAAKAIWAKYGFETN